MSLLALSWRSTRTCTTHRTVDLELRRVGPLFRKTSAPGSKAKDSQRDTDRQKRCSAFDNRCVGQTARQEIEAVWIPRDETQNRRILEQIKHDVDERAILLVGERRSWALADTVAKKIDAFANAVQLAAQPEGMQFGRSAARLALAAFDPPRYIAIY